MVTPEKIVDHSNDISQEFCAKEIQAEPIHRYIASTWDSETRAILEGHDQGPAF